MDKIQMAKDLFIKLEKIDKQDFDESQAIRRARIIALMRTNR